MRVGKAIELFVAMGCVLREITPDDNPDLTRPIRFLYNPETDEFVSVLDYEDDEFLPPSELENWERRLGMEVRKGKPN